MTKPTKRAKRPPEWPDGRPDGLQMATRYDWAVKLLLGVILTAALGFGTTLLTARIDRVEKSVDALQQDSKLLYEIHGGVKMLIELSGRRMPEVKRSAK